MPFNPNTHHRRSIRLKDYDYSRTGFYFITICTHSRLPIFGRIDDRRMVLNQNGRIARDEWRQNIGNSLQYIFKCLRGDAQPILSTALSKSVGARCIVPQQRIVSLPLNNSANQHQIPFRPSFAGYKSAVTKRIKNLTNQTDLQVWQRNYYEHIIRDEQSHRQIAEYIQNNPITWKDDRYYENP